MSIRRRLPVLIAALIGLALLAAGFTFLREGSPDDRGSGGGASGSELKGKGSNDPGGRSGRAAAATAAQAPGIARSGRYRYRYMVDQNGIRKDYTVIQELGRPTRSGPEVSQTIAELRSDGEYVLYFVKRGSTLVLTKTVNRNDAGRENQCNYEPDLLWRQFPLTPGRTWTRDGICPQRGGGSLSENLRSTVTGTRQMTVGRVTVMAVVIESSGKRVIEAPPLPNVSQNLKITEFYDPIRDLLLRRRMVESGVHLARGDSYRATQDIRLISLTPLAA